MANSQNVAKQAWKRKAFSKSSKCRYCGVAMEIGCGGMREATVDHRVPKSAGGHNSVKNYVLCCRGCNSRKASMPYADFMAMLVGEALGGKNEY